MALFSKNKSAPKTKPPAPVPSPKKTPKPSKLPKPKPSKTKPRDAATAVTDITTTTTATPLERLEHLRTQLSAAMDFDPHTLVPYLRMTRSPVKTPIHNTDGTPITLDKAQLLADAIELPSNKGVPFVALCSFVGYENEDFLQLVEMMEQFHVGVARLESGPEVVKLFKDVIKDGFSAEIPCQDEDCDSGLRISTGKLCQTCMGTGKIRRPGDRHSRSLIFEAFGFVGKNKNVNPNQTNIGNITNMNISIGGVQERSVGFAQRLLEVGRANGPTVTGGPVTEAEVVGE